MSMQKFYYIGICTNKTQSMFSCFQNSPRTYFLKYCLYNIIYNVFQRLLGGYGITYQIWVSHYRGEFYNAEFPHDLTHLVSTVYTILYIAAILMYCSSHSCGIRTLQTRFYVGNITVNFHQFASILWLKYWKDTDAATLIFG